VYGGVFTTTFKKETKFKQASTLNANFMMVCTDTFQQFATTKRIITFVRHPVYSKSLAGCFAWCAESFNIRIFFLLLGPLLDMQHTVFVDP